MSEQRSEPFIDWDALGILYHTGGSKRVIRNDPLWILVTTARQGHEGGIEDMKIVLSDGTIYGPDEISALAKRPDRKRL
jgi:hypothetical protein